MYGCKGTVAACFALIALAAWKYLFDSALRKLSVPQSTVEMVRFQGRSLSC